jgi:hypothetical protein
MYVCMYIYVHTYISVRVYIRTQMKGMHISDIEMFVNVFFAQAKNHLKKRQNRN